MSPFVILSCALITHFVVNCEEGLTTRIVMGTDADIDEVPFQVSLRRAKNGKHYCGASILNSMWILTAAHCLKASEERNFNVQYGVTTITSTGPNIVNVSKIVVHPGYDRSRVIHDIALIRLEEPIELGESAQPVRLPRMFQSTEAGTAAVLAGWGRNATGGIHQNHLQKVELTIFSKETCNSIYQNRLHITNICAGIEEGGRGQCNGDSGGALISNGVQVGIVSWSRKPCATAPGVFTEVSNYIDWIEGTIKKDAVGRIKMRQ